MQHFSQLPSSTEQDGTIVIEAEENLDVLKKVMKKFLSME